MLIGKITKKNEAKVDLISKVVESGGKIQFWRQSIMINKLNEVRNFPSKVLFSKS